MTITSISQKQLSDYEINALIDLKSVPREKIENTKVENQQNKFMWQKDIILSAIDALENNIQMENNHPLSKVVNAPIESFDEALIELNYIKSPFFRNSASQAQANIKPNDVLYLFI